MSSSYSESRTQTKLHWESKNKVGWQSELHVLNTGHNSVAKREEENKKLKFYLSIFREQEREEDKKKKKAPN